MHPFWQNYSHFEIFFMIFCQCVCVRAIPLTIPGRRKVLPLSDSLFFTLPRTAFFTHYNTHGQFILTILPPWGIFVVFYPLDKNKDFPYPPHLPPQAERSEPPPPTKAAISSSQVLPGILSDKDTPVWQMGLSKVKCLQLYWPPCRFPLLVVFWYNNFFCYFISRIIVLW